MTTETRELTFQEREALHVLRKSIVRKPWIVEELAKGLSKEMANRTLQQVSVELAQLLEVNRAFSAACAAIVKETE